MTDVTQTAVSRGQFIKNGAKGSLVLVGAGGALATMDGVAFAKGVTKSDIATLQVGYIAESLAVVVYSAIIKNFSSFKGLQNKDYFVAALKNEKDHKAAWAKALGSKNTPTGFKLTHPQGRHRQHQGADLDGCRPGGRLRVDLPRCRQHVQLDRPEGSCCRCRRQRGVALQLL